MFYFLIKPDLEQQLLALLSYFSSELLNWWGWCDDCRASVWLVSGATVMSHNINDKTHHNLESLAVACSTWYQRSTKCRSGEHLVQ